MWINFWRIGKYKMSNDWETMFCGHNDDLRELWRIAELGKKCKVVKVIPVQDKVKLTAYSDKWGFRQVYTSNAVTLSESEIVRELCTNGRQIKFMP